MLTFDDIKNSREVQAYIRRADDTLTVLGYTEHALAHVTRTAQKAAEILSCLGYEPRTVELAQIAGYIHDIGNVINRVDHAQSGAVMAFVLLTKLGMDAEEIASIITAIGNHDESTAVPVSPITAALILADKSDVRRSRVRNRNTTTFDIHDRVNYAVERSELYLDSDHNTITLKLTIDTKICPVMDYFEIFLGRMMLCRKAADFLRLTFDLIINEVQLL